MPGKGLPSAGRGGGSVGVGTGRGISGWGADGGGADKGGAAGRAGGFRPPLHRLRAQPHLPRGDWGDGLRESENRTGHLAGARSGDTAGGVPGRAGAAAARKGGGNHAETHSAAVRAVCRERAVGDAGDGGDLRVYGRLCGAAAVSAPAAGGDGQVRRGLLRGERRLHVGRGGGIRGGAAAGDRLLFAGRGVGLDAERLLPEGERDFDGEVFPLKGLAPPLFPLAGASL